MWPYQCFQLNMLRADVLKIKHKPNDAEIAQEGTWDVLLNYSHLCFLSFRTIQSTTSPNIWHTRCTTWTAHLNLIVRRWGLTDLVLFGHRRSCTEILGSCREEFLLFLLLDFKNNNKRTQISELKAGRNFLGIYYIVHRLHLSFAQIVGMLI